MKDGSFEIFNDAHHVFSLYRSSFTHTVDPTLPRSVLTLSGLACVISCVGPSRYREVVLTSFGVACMIRYVEPTRYCVPVLTSFATPCSVAIPGEPCDEGWPRDGHPYKMFTVYRS